MANEHEVGVWLDALVPVDFWQFTSGGKVLCEWLFVRPRS
jgi:hypothetical protein